ncbi:hypothetical protein MMARJ_10990 [Mycobacterium marseillense]|uniref:Uncharacterized protein n=1 Tax=Mycobacterium marseillense TaxID=701042 RepID=A0ABM7J8X9_9MYCO|nr:hypothetical protein MMARJ_10990 [Mycobacterium marseillense]
MPGADRAQELLVAESEKEQPEVTYRPEAGVGRGGRDVVEAEREAGGDEVDDHPVGRLSRAVEIAFAVQRARRELLMPQRLSRPLVDVSAKVAEGGVRRRRQRQGHHAGEHAGMRLRFGVHAPADRKVEHDFVGTVGAPAPHQKRAGRGEYR